jgi:AraC-like DNA-binding protein
MKTPPRQITRWFRSDDTLDSQDNFQSYLTILGNEIHCPAIRCRYVFDVQHCAPAKHKPFRYRLRISNSMQSIMTYQHVSAYTSCHQLSESSSEHYVLLQYVLKGHLTLTVKGRSFDLTRGTFCLRDPSEQCVYVTHQDIEMVSLLVPNDYFFAHAGFHTSTFLGHVFKPSSTSCRLFHRLMALTNEELNHLDARDLDNICDGLLCFLRPVLSEYARTVADSSLSTRDRLRTRAIDAMQKCLDKPGTQCRDIADKVGVSVRYLSDLFRDIGTTPMRHLMRLRLERAGAYLHEQHLTDASVEEIALANGFASSAHFCRAFKIHFGTTPLQWKRNGPVKQPN